MVQRPFSELNFLAIQWALGHHWRRPPTYSFVTRLGRVPVSDSEVLQTSHHLPLAIEHSAFGLHVVALSHSSLNRTSPVSDDGRWRRAYMPIALRCLPFRLSPPGQKGATLEISPELGLAPPKPGGSPLTTKDEHLQADLQPIANLLTRFDVGHKRLNRAAERLFLAGVLTALPHASSGETEYLTVDPALFEELPPTQAAYLARDHFLPMDLVAACLFSRRLLPDEVARFAPVPGRQRSTIAGEVNDLLQHVTDVNVKVDDSELFSFDLFDRAGNTP